MEKYLRRSQFWEPADGDIDAVEVLHPAYSRPVNSDVLALMENVVSDTAIPSTYDPGARRRDFDLPHRDILVWWARERDQHDSEVVSAIDSVSNIDRLPRDEECFINRGEPISRTEEALDLSVGTILWGGEHILQIATHYLDDAPGGVVFGSLPYYQTARTRASSALQLLDTTWRTDCAVSYREMAFLTYAARGRFSFDDLRMSELIYVACHNRSLITDVSRSAPATADDKFGFRSWFTGEIRNVAEPESALAWFLHFNKRGEGHNEHRIPRQFTEEMREEVLRLAAEFSYEQAAPYISLGIWDANIIRAAVEEKIDLDFAVALATEGSRAVA